MASPRRGAFVRPGSTPVTPDSADSRALYLWITRASTLPTPINTSLVPAPFERAFEIEYDSITYYWLHRPNRGGEVVSTSLTDPTGANIVHERLYT